MTYTSPVWVQNGMVIYLRIPTAKWKDFGHSATCLRNHKYTFTFLSKVVSSQAKQRVKGKVFV